MIVIIRANNIITYVAKADQEFYKGPLPFIKSSGPFKYIK